MPVHKKEHTPRDDKGATPNVVSPEELKPEHFHQYLRAEILDATLTVMEAIMRPRTEPLSRCGVGRMHAHASRLSQWVLHA